MEIMRSLWARSKALVERSENVVPMRLRLGGVSQGVAIDSNSNQPVMVRALVALTGPDYKIQQGEALRLIDNVQDQHLWKVRTATGDHDVPSICFWFTSNDSEATDRAIAYVQFALLLICKSSHSVIKCTCRVTQRKNAEFCAAKLPRKAWFCVRTLKMPTM